MKNISTTTTTTITTITNNSYETKRKTLILTATVFNARHKDNYLNERLLIGRKKNLSFGRTCRGKQNSIAQSRKVVQRRQSEDKNINKYK